MTYQDAVSPLVPLWDLLPLPVGAPWPELDAPPIDALEQLAAGGRYRVDLCKVPHHGSRHNTSPDLLALLDCRHWLLSTSGHRHGHPNREAMARILCRPDEATAWFNYRGQTTEEYAGPALGARYGFAAVHPAPGRPGIALRVGHGRVERAG